MEYSDRPGTNSDRFVKALIGTGAAKAIGRCMKLAEDLEATAWKAATYLAADVPREDWKKNLWDEANRKVERSKKRRAERDRVLTIIRKMQSPKFEADVAFEVRTHVLPYLARPLPLTRYELDAEMESIALNASDYVSKEDEDEYNTDGALIQFCESLTYATQHVQHAEFELCQLSGDPEETFPETLWDGAHAQIRLLLLVREDRRVVTLTGTRIPELPWTLRAEVRGYATQSAVDHAKAEAERVTRALLRLAVDLVEYDERPFYPGRLPICEPSQLHDALPLMREWLSSYYGAKPKETSLDWRIRNAIQLIVEAGHQVNDAVAVPLLCAAMEALVGGDREATTKMLADYVATILEPDGGRRHEAISFVKKLYADRSAVMHGGTTNIGARSRSYARILCAHLLRAVIDWRHFQAKIYGKDDAHTFMDELRKLAPAAKILPTAKEDAVVRRLWMREGA